MVASLGRKMGKMCFSSLTIFPFIKQATMTVIQLSLLHELVYQFYTRGDPKITGIDLLRMRAF
jgi:hypothetical protein